MSDDCPNKETMVGGLVTFGDLCRAQVEVHAVVLTGDGTDVKV